MKLIKIVLLLLSLLTSSLSFAAFTKPPPPPSTGSATLDAINKFIYDTVNWQQGDPVPDTGSSTLNAIAQSMLDTANYGSGSSGSAGGGFSGTGAGGSWSSDPYNGNGGSGSGAGAGGSWSSDQNTCSVQYVYLSSVTNKTYSTPEAACDYLKVINNGAGAPGVTFSHASNDLCYYNNKGSEVAWSRYFKQSNPAYSSSCTCKTGEYYSSTYNKCIPKCDDGRSLYDPSTNTCKVNPQQCQSPYTLINGVCVPPKQPDPETKTCPYGYTLDTATNSCVKDPEKPCDPAVQECNPDGTVKCDCCQKLDTIIGNQGVQIGLQNKSNASLAQIIANQQTNNLKIDQLNNQLTQLNSIAQNTNSNLQVIQNQIAELLKLQKEGVKLDIEPITKKIDEIITNANKNQADKLTNDNKNHNDLTGLIAKSLIDSETAKPYLKEIFDYMKQQPQTNASAVGATDLQPVTDRQDEQTGILKEIRDLFKEDTENPTPPPDVTPEEQESSLNNPLDGLKNYDISQNRFGGAAQCPNDRQFVALGATFTIAMSRFCDYLAMFGSVFLAMAYIAGGIIVVKGAGGN